MSSDDCRDEDCGEVNGRVRVFREYKGSRGC